FVALCLPFDYHMYLPTAEGRKNPRSISFEKPYFIVAFLLYAAGLTTTVLVMHVFHAAQPALLYLSPACIRSVLITGAVRGEIKDV
ncbi:peptidase A22B, signal peptide peptidase, partial [Gaertneriomyces semiglobifer]